jgi:hypothetical protein
MFWHCVRYIETYSSYSTEYRLTHLQLLDIEKLFNLTHAYAELGNRTKPNFNDIARGLEEAGLRLSDFEEYLNGLKDQGILCM